MCYSAGASFVGVAVISAVGVATVKEAGHPSRLAFGAFPCCSGFNRSPKVSCG